MSDFKPEVAVTAIIRMDDSEVGRYLLTKRAPTKKRFPNKWTVPGGHVELRDFINVPANADGWVYGVVEAALHREVSEEVGIRVKDLEYLTSMATQNEVGQVLVVSMTAVLDGSSLVTYEPREVSDYAWATLEEARTIGLIEGIYEELELAEQRYQVVLSGREA